MKTISKKNINRYLKEIHFCTLKDLFKSHNRHHVKTAEILNDVYREFTDHNFTNGQFITSNPFNSEEKVVYKHYKNFNHLNTPKQMIEEMEHFIKLRKRVFSRQQSRLQFLEQGKNKQQILER